MVYRAHQPDLDRWVAIKLLPLTEKQSLRRFDQERKAMGRLSQHPGIVTIHDSGITERDEPYLVMSYHPRGSLRDRLRDFGPLHWNEASNLALEVAETLAYAHGEGIVHRDIKPGNILVSDSGKPLLTDFGVAHLIDRPPTSTTTVAGLTPAYSPPELLQGETVGVPADVYSLGATLFNLIAGSPPFHSTSGQETISAIIERILSADVPDLREHGIPDPICGVIERAMAKAPEDRYQSADEFARELREAIVESPDVRAGNSSVFRELEATETAPSPEVQSASIAAVEELSPVGIAEFGVEMDTDQERRAIRVSMPDNTTASDMEQAIKTACSLNTRARMRRVTDGVPLIPSSPAVGQVAQGQRLTVDSVAPVIHSSTSHEIHVIGGPCSGQRWTLTEGDLQIGRSEGVDIRLEDQRLSRTHAVIGMRDNMITVTDAHSSNGTFIDGKRLTGPVDISDGTIVELGASLITVRRSSGDVVVPPQQPWEEHNRPPRIAEPQSTTDHTLSAPPESGRAMAVQWGAVLLPVILGLGMAFMFQTMYMLMFALLSPAMIVWNRFAEKRNMGKMFQGGESKFRADVEELTTTLASERVAETRARHQADPDPCLILDGVRARTEQLWHRRPGDDDYLNLRIGWADQESFHRVVIEPGGEDSLREEAQEKLGAYSQVSSVPLGLDLPAAGIAGLVGGHKEVDSVARWLVCQTIALQSPRDLALYAVVPAEIDTDWDWLRWLPHTSGLQAQLVSPTLAASTNQSIAVTDALISTVRQRQGRRRGGESETGPTIVALLYGQAIRDRSSLSQVLIDGPEVGVYVIWVEETSAKLPGECRAVVSIDPDSAQATLTMADSGKAVAAGGYDGVSVDYARDLAEAIAPVRDASAGSVSGDIPERVDLAELLRLPTASPQVIGDRWRQAPPGLRANIGLTKRGPHILDLERDGPHGLIGGMTNSGKSELLQTLVLSLTATYPPDRLNLLLIDYKGGTAFKDCVDLPHTVGLITDLDDHLVSRALSSLHAEIRRRERLLRDHGAKDFIELRRLHPQTPTASLVIVVDEFYALATELPEFITGMVDVASRGRALGLHLLLATQRPADSVVNENIRANANLKISLRVADDQDSIGIIGTPDAARIDKDLPGRAFIRTGHDELSQVQTAFAGGRQLESVQRDEISVTALDFAGNPVTSEHEDSSSDVSDAQRLVEAMVQTAREQGLKPPSAPWVPPLDSHVSLDAVYESFEDDVATLGLLDLPEDQTQRPWIFDLTSSGSMVVYGTGGSGKTTLLRTLVFSLAKGRSPERLHVYGLDFASKGLAGLEALPHCGGVAFSDDNERVLRLLSQLEREISERKNLFAAAGASSLSEYRSAADPDTPRIVVLLDSYGGFASAMQEVDHGAPVERFTRILTDGQAVGVNVILTASRKAEVPGSITGQISSTLVLRMANDEEYSSLGIPGGSFPSGSPPGRGYVNGTVEGQIAVIGADGSAAGQAQALAELAKSAKEDFPNREAPPIRVLPLDLPSDNLPTPEDPFAPFLGVDDEDVLPVAVDLSDSGFLVVGPPRSGRTTALGALASSMRAAGPDLELHLVAPRRTALLDLGIWTSVHQGLAAADDFGTQLDEGLGSRTFDSPPLILVIDDGEELADSVSARSYENIVRRGRDVGIRVVGACEVQSAHRAFGSWINEIRKHKVGLLLTPDFDVDGDLFGVRLPRTTQRRFPPGRGFLVERGFLRLIQVASARS